MYGFDSAKPYAGLNLFQESQSTLSKVRLFIEQGYSFNQEELIFRTRHNESLHLQTNASGIVENDKLIRIWGASHNISSNRHYQARVDFLANHDSPHSTAQPHLLVPFY